ncbi:MAG TPA: flagellar biosynthesis protein FliQ [Thermodesulforhabdus norvegica]|uniref:Flagellar biosynthetic protein FliQ n=1 Tax=Thermodesulforhabdus norvegica TaxID=39841 RepID=A0A7C0WRI1_9BACT|nr:flagellar biosynthesis protein FliQ [Deltaproteobacteria bacterium]MBW2068330.1 flagellar biosynthesis protein FliQ [Deltaproteobacteria bacterium]HDL89624.1 flagellar biosynthesis protein FliQ [Thermodesulforhabdus norvegica]
MTPEFVVGLGRQALETMLAVSLPVLLISLIVGVLISIFQTVTQVQEATITFVPKIIVTFLSLLIFGNWMIAKLTDFTQRILENIPNWIR